MFVIIKTILHDTPQIIEDQDDLVTLSIIMHLVKVNAIISTHQTLPIFNPAGSRVPDYSTILLEL